MRNPVFGFPTRSDTNQAVQEQKMARGFKFRIKEDEGLCYRCSENNGADQLHSYREADLRLCCFRIMQKAGFLTSRLIYECRMFCCCFFSNGQSTCTRNNILTQFTCLVKI